MHRLYKIFMLFFLVCFSLEVKGQHTLTGRVTDAESNTLAFASVILLSAKDSSFVKGEITNEVGRYVIEDLETGTYQLTASMVGYEAKQPDLVTLQQDVLKLTMPDIILNEGLGLDEITIVSTRPLYEMSADRMVMNG